MEIIDYISIFLSILSTVGFQIFSFKFLSKDSEFSISKLKIVVVSLILVSIFIININDIGVMKAPICFLLTVIVNKLFYNNNFLSTFLATSICYIVAVICEIMLSVLTIKFNIFDYTSFYDNSIILFFFNFSVGFISYLICKYFNFLSKIFNKLNDYLCKRSIRFIFILIILIVLLLIDFKYIMNFDFSTYIINLILVILMSILSYEFFKGEFKINSELDKIDILLDNISKYEAIIDNNRINNHEILNNLLLLKSYKNKNSKKYENLLDSIISNYDKNSDTIKNISILPKNIKGIIYYMMFNLESYNIVSHVNISKRISSDLERLEEDEYIILCKIIPILLDNAVYSCKNSYEKKLLVDFYKERDSIIISIENSFSGNIDKKNISKKYYSTKGDNRGLGLYIVDKLLTKSKSLVIKYDINNNLFVSKIIIKNKMD